MADAFRGDAGGKEGEGGGVTGGAPRPNITFSFSDNRLAVDEESLPPGDGGFNGTTVRSTNNAKTNGSGPVMAAAVFVAIIASLTAIVVHRRRRNQARRADPYKTGDVRPVSPKSPKRQDAQSTPYSSTPNKASIYETPVPLKNKFRNNNWIPTPMLGGASDAIHSGSPHGIVQLPPNLALSPAGKQKTAAVHYETSTAMTAKQPDYDLAGSKILSETSSQLQTYDKASAGGPTVEAVGQPTYDIADDFDQSGFEPQYQSAAVAKSTPIGQSTPPKSSVTMVMPAAHGSPVSTGGQMSRRRTPAGKGGGKINTQGRKKEPPKLGALIEGDARSPPRTLPRRGTAEKLIDFWKTSMAAVRKTVGQSTESRRPASPPPSTIAETDSTVPETPLPPLPPAEPVGKLQRMGRESEPPSLPRRGTAERLIGLYEKLPKMSTLSNTQTAGPVNDTVTLTDGSIGADYREATGPLKGADYRQAACSPNGEYADPGQYDQKDK